MTISLAFLAPNLVKAAVEGRLPAASASSGSAICRLNGASSSSYSASVRNNSTPSPHLELRKQSQLRLRTRPEAAPQPDAGNRILGCRQMSRSNTPPYAEIKVWELDRRKSSQKRPIWRPARFARDGGGGDSWARTGDPPSSHRTGLRPAPGTEISSAEIGRQKPAHHLAETDLETRRKLGNTSPFRVGNISNEAARPAKNSEPPIFGGSL